MALSDHPIASVLIVDDEPLVVAFVQRLLQDAGYRTYECVGGHSAIRFMNDHAGYVDTVLTDVVMPEIDGLRVAASAKAKWPAARVVYMSGSGEGTTLLPSEDFFLPKPFNREQLLAIVLPYRIDVNRVHSPCVAI